jgi:hypothetical protein
MFDRQHDGGPGADLWFRQHDRRGIGSLGNTVILN